MTATVWKRSALMGAVAGLAFGLIPLGAAADDVPCDPATGLPCDPPPTPSTPPPTPDYTPGPNPTSPTDNLAPLEDRVPGKISKVKPFFGDSLRGKLLVRWSEAERATAYRVRIVKVVVQGQRKGGSSKQKRRILKPRAWQETTQRAYRWDVTPGLRYRVQVKGVNNVGSGPIAAAEFIVP